MRIPRRAPIALLVVIAEVALLAACGSAPSHAAPGVVKVVAAENFYGDIVRRLGGAHVEVRSLIDDPTADPHQYESDARDAGSVADARLVVVNGLGYDDFVAKLLAGTSNHARVVLSVADVLHVNGADANPHLWYDVPRMPEVARAIDAALAAADPADRAVFVANLNAFDDSLVPLQKVIAEIRSRYPGAPVAYTERVPGYLIAAAGLRNVAPEGFARAIEDGNEPNARDAKAFDDLVAGHRIRVLLYNAQATSPVTQRVQDLARRAGVPIVAVTETQPLTEPSYQSWQLHQLGALLSALGG